MSKASKKFRRRPQVARTLPALKRTLETLRHRGEKIALVPTMGALHGGHLSLVRLAQRRAERVIVSIFVNPTQFAPHEDLATYPRTWDEDLAALRAMNVDLVWAPTTETMYPPGFATRIAPEGPAKAGLEDRFRPHFFGGVATVVTKLLLQCEADFALFGEKDYQQLKVVSRLVRDLAIKTRIVPGPTVRAPDGLAMSSRNLFLSPAERETAPVLYRVLKETAAAIKAGQSIAATLAEGCKSIEQAGFTVDYLEARNAETLAPIESPKAADKKEPIRLLVAARIGTTRLIDNIAV
jgi:pantoate--beta-alanine ligase